MKGYIKYINISQKQEAKVHTDEANSCVCLKVCTKKNKAKNVKIKYIKIIKIKYMKIQVESSSVEIQKLRK